MSHYSYLILLFALFVVPRILQRYRIPTAITSFALGALSGLQLDLFRDDATVRLLATFGVISLFLFAGLDVDLIELRREARVLGQHIVLQVAGLALAAWSAAAALGLGPRASILLSLALLTPSTGFILHSIDGFGLPARARFWIKSKAIASELVALAALFVALQSTSPLELARSTLVLAAMIGLLPLLFRFFASFVVPYAPKSEFAFLMMVAVACGMVTYQLGVYYLVGAFLVGMAARRFRERAPAMASDQMVASVEAFSSLFVPFYFFFAGLSLRAEDVGFAALGLGLAFFVAGVALRVGLVSLHRRIALRESLRESWLISVPLLPTLVFTLVVAGILRDRGEVAPPIVGGLIVYAILSSIVPAFVLRRPLPEVEDELLRGAAPAPEP